ncbi:Glycosyltransferase (GlcNAc) [Methylophaga frappieri]|uniref:Glycosyltransferase (GlcNAc) n=1 Tax=Methylophaga frappieri (strain ATCC BAA-2434 / DSM 25690 / JAM7) TaxID=754477 RepID=I1YKK7_METFJ|nr:glycosyltransferase (GlcNAc) [Methylophaga frappieri]AFJ03450.1 Glycosyltransferase (GlcNAc) [Methylophaga frappieri]
MNEKIFVSIASYRDPELAATVTDLFAKAAYPKRLHVQILNQIEPEDTDCRISANPQVQVDQVAASDSLGVCWARHHIQQKLPADAAYYLQIDSHMRFAADWDVQMIAMLPACASQRPILSCYPVAYTPPDQLGKPMITRLKPKKFNHHGIVTLDSETTPYRQRPALPALSALVAGGFIFAPAQAFREVIYDPYLYFIGEEITLSARLWTQGWDSFAPNEVLIYHNYQPEQRPRHWDDNQRWSALNQRSIQRVHYLLSAMPPTDPAALIEIAHYGLGQRRTLENYQRLINVRFADGIAV